MKTAIAPPIASFCREPGSPPTGSRVGRTRAICHLIASNFAGGPEKQILEQSRRLRDHGWSVVIGSFQENRPSVEVLDLARESRIPVFSLRTRSPFSPLSTRRLRQELDRRGIDLLITHGYKANLVGHVASRGARWRQVPMVRGYTGEDWKVRTYESVDRRLLARLPRILCVSAAMRRSLASWGIDPDRVDVLHNSVDIPEDVASVDPRAEFGFPDTAAVLIAAGRLSPEKGHLDLIDAMARIRLSAGLDARAVIFGDGPLRGRLAAEIERRGLSELVVLGGFRRPVLPYLRAADLVVNPSRSEGLPNVVLEAQSVATPVVATAVGGVPEIIEDGVTGFLAPARSPGDLADRIRDALQDPVRSEAIGAAGLARVRTHFSFSTQMERLVTYVDHVLEASS